MGRKRTGQESKVRNRTVKDGIYCIMYISFISIYIFSLSLYHSIIYILSFLYFLPVYSFNCLYPILFIFSPCLFIQYFISYPFYNFSLSIHSIIYILSFLYFLPVYLFNYLYPILFIFSPCLFI